ncbi:hypothetical protein HDV00_007455 [Rhizophlyctis rosea]|nr:hypothetical protein HDV00_007455 [Rhizophlyctis rosea]
MTIPLSTPPTLKIKSIKRISSSILLAHIHSPSPLRRASTVLPLTKSSFVANLNEKTIKILSVKKAKKNKRKKMMKRSEVLKRRAAGIKEGGKDDANGEGYFLALAVPIGEYEDGDVVRVVVADDVLLKGGGMGVWSVGRAERVLMKGL